MWQELGWFGVYGFPELSVYDSNPPLSDQVKAILDTPYMKYHFRMPTIEEIWLGVPYVASA